MHIIIDANCSADALTPTPKPEFSPLIRAILEGKKKLAVGGTKQKREYMKNTKAWKYIQLLDQAGRAFLVSDIKVDEEELVIKANIPLVSDDPHLLALARLSGARILCSLDQALHTDFCNPRIISKPRGRVYQNATHENLLIR